MGALEGLRRIDFGILVQGPQAAGMLRDMGADVVNIELPGVYLTTGRQPGPADGGHPLVHASYGLVPTSDGHIAIVGSTGRGRAALFSTVCRLDRADDPRYMDRMMDPQVGAI